MPAKTFQRSQSLTTARSFDGLRGLMVKTRPSKTCRRQCRFESCRGDSWKFRAAAASQEQRPGNYNHRPLHNSAIMVVICVDARGQDEGYLLGLGMCVCVCVCVSESLAHADRNHDSYIYIFALALRPTYLQPVGLSFAFMGALARNLTESVGWLRCRHGCQFTEKRLCPADTHKLYI